MIWFEDVSSRNDRIINPYTGERMVSKTPYVEYTNPFSGKKLRKFVDELEYNPRESEVVLMESHSVKLVEDITIGTERYEGKFSLLIYFEESSNGEFHGVSVIRDGEITDGLNPTDNLSNDILKISFSDTTYMDLYQMIGEEYMKREVELGNYVKVEKEEVE